MRFDVVTIFPRMFESPMAESMLRLAQEREIAQIIVHDLRDYTTDKHRQVDDVPYGGGPGMVMKPEPFFAAVEHISARFGAPQETIMMSPRGERLTQRVMAELAGARHILLLCGRYEGVDERVHEHLVTREISIGDYVLTGGELPAMVVIDGVVRLLEGVLGDEESAVRDSFSDGLLEYPQYTRPTTFRGWDVPEVLLSGNHGEIRRWRERKAREVTEERRPDLLSSGGADG